MTFARTARSGWLAGALLLVMAGALDAHHSIIMFDVETLVRVEGVIVRFDPVNPHSYLIVEETARGGPVQRWALEGPSGVQLERRGFNAGMFKVGETIAACGFVLKTENRGSRSVDGRVLLATTLRLADGQGRIWSDYGQAHRCTALDSTTHYSRWFDGERRP